MRLVNREQFLQLPSGIVFMKYAPMYTEDLAIKSNITESGNDYIYADVVGISAIDTEEASTRTENQEFLNLVAIAIGEDKPAGTVSFKTDLENYGRDGCYDKSQLFIVYEQADIDKLINKLQTAVGAVFKD